MWAFMSMWAKDLLHNSPVWFVDGTFQASASTLFYQLWIISARDPDTGMTFTALQALLPNKKGEAYSMIFERLQKAGIAGPTVCHMDFEEAEIKSFKKHYPEAEVMGCDIHFKR